MVLRSYKLGAPPTWAIQLRVTSRVIGSIGMRNINEEHHHAEFGYALTPEFWNQGYATEAVRAVLAHGLRHMNLNRMEAKVVPEHTASRRVLEKAGMHLEGILRQIEYFKGAYHDLAIYSMLRSDLDEKR
jgi:ribosomal-protein-alanine N-acetyltransferase